MKVMSMYWYSWQVISLWMAHVFVSTVQISQRWIDKSVCLKYDKVKATQDKFSSILHQEMLFSGILLPVQHDRYRSIHFFRQTFENPDPQCLIAGSLKNTQDMLTSYGQVSNNLLFKAL
jgi:hypothetical protein